MTMIVKVVNLSNWGGDDIRVSQRMVDDVIVEPGESMDVQMSLLGHDGHSTLVITPQVEDKGIMKNKRGRRVTPIMEIKMKEEA